MSAPLIPQVFWFRMALPCTRIDALPRSGRGRLLDLAPECALPDFSRLEGHASWAEVRVAWNPKGLGVSFEVTGKTGPIVSDPERPLASDGVQLWIDTRDTRNAHRATRFCHRFVATLAPGGRGVNVSQRAIGRAQADAPIARPEAVLSRVDARKSGWLLELFLNAEALHGFDPETNRRLGFAFQVTDPARDDLYLSVGREFPVAEDPSLWATLELREPD
ncbi:MAG TPA: hypothetical protein VGY53_04355 [Isosphaeraceae bacterium]|jgi:hypothetical protein|nr:hypothetical protein [Isosphaeraceae bacterium]